MTDDPRLTPLAASLPATVPFVGPEAQERARAKAFRARLGANESVFGPSPKAVAAMQAAASGASAIFELNILCICPTGIVVIASPTMFFQPTIHIII